MKKLIKAISLTVCAAIMMSLMIDISAFSADADDWTITGGTPTITGNMNAGYEILFTSTAPGGKNGMEIMYNQESDLTVTGVKLKFSTSNSWIAFSVKRQDNSLIAGYYLYFHDADSGSGKDLRVTPMTNPNANKNIIRNFDFDKEHILRFSQVDGKWFFMIDELLCDETSKPDVQGFEATAALADAGFKGHFSVSTEASLNAYAKIRALDDLNERVCGDINGDGEINAKDIAMLRLTLVTQENAQDRYSDVNLSGNTDIRDLVRLKRIISTKPQVIPKLYVADYGAVGDGVTDDTNAVNNAVSAALAYNGRVQVEFESQKTYYIGGNGNLTGQGVFKGALIVENGSDISFNGNGSTLILKPGQVAACITGCENVAVTNFNIRYKIPTYLVATVTGRGTDYVDYSTDYPVNMNGSTVYYAPVNDYFGIPYSENSYGVQTRSHRWISKIEKLAQNSCRVYFRKSASSTAAGIGVVPDSGVYSSGTKWFIPNPQVGQAFGEIFFVGFNGTVDFCDINVYEASSFVFGIKGNEGTITFDRVNLVTEKKRELNMVSWRDGFHCKDNLSPLIFNSCVAEGLFDDTLNISATMHQVTAVSSAKTLDIRCFEFGGAYYGFSPGDEITVIDPTGSGSVRGTAKITAAVPLASGGYRITLDSPIYNVIAGDRLTVNNRAAPDSQINNCNFSGTFRFRGSLTVKNTVFKPLSLWIMYEGFAEGPIPRDIHFSKCRFYGGTIEVGNYSREFSQTLSGIATENITFTQCGFEGCTQKLYAGSNVSW